MCLQQIKFILITKFFIISMDTNQFKRKQMNSSSSDSDQNSDQIMGDDEPTTIKIVRVQSTVDSQSFSPKPVVITYNIDKNNSVDSKKSSKMSSQSKPSIYEEVQRQQVSYNYTEKRYQRDHQHYNQKRPNYGYINSEKSQHQDNRWSNHSQSNNQGRFLDRRENNGNYHRDNYKHPQGFRDNERYNNNGNYEGNNYQKGYGENPYHQQNQRNHYRNEENQHYRRYDQRQNQKYDKNQYQQTNGYKHHETPNLVQDERYMFREKEKKKEQVREREIEIERNRKQKQLKQTQLSSPSSQRVGKKQEQVIEKPKQKLEPKMQKQSQKVKSLNNNKELKKNQNQRQSYQKQKQQQNNIPKTTQPKKEQKTQINRPNNYNNLKPDSSNNSNINNRSIQTSSRMSEMNRAQSKIVIENSVQQEKINQKLEQSVWDAYSDEQEEGGYGNNKSSYECHQISMEYPLPPPIPGHCESYSNIQEDLSLIEALENHNNKSSQIHPGFNPCISKLAIPPSQQNDNSLSFEDKESVLFDEKEIQTISRMFGKIPMESQSVFVELKVKTSNVSLYRVKSVSSQIFQLRNTKTQDVKNNGFIVIKQSQKMVPRDSEPFSQIIARNNNSNIELKRSKMVLAQIKNPLMLLQHSKTYQLQQQKHLLSKILVNKDKFKDVSSLISIDEITLRCSSCNSKKSFMWSNQIIPHQCKLECANFLRFEIQAMYTC